MHFGADGHAHAGCIRLLAQVAHELHQHDLFFQRVEERGQIGQGPGVGQVRGAGHVQFVRAFVQCHRFEGVGQRVGRATHRLVAGAGGDGSHGLRGFR